MKDLKIAIGYAALLLLLTTIPVIGYKWHQSTVNYFVGDIIIFYDNGAYQEERVPNIGVIITKVSTNNISGSVTTEYTVQFPCLAVSGNRYCKQGVLLQDIYKRL